MHTGKLGKLRSLDARGKFGRSGGFGRIAFGWNWFGFYNWFCGIYSKKYYFGKPYISRMKFYRPTNPQTPTQQAWRATFADAMTAWGALSAPQKEPYIKRAKKLQMTGANLFLKQYLREHA
ncbi:MAG: hypothetical protein V4538_17705 [Bacteroidota bacterium]